MAGASARSSPLHVRFGEFELDEANALLLRGGSAIALSPTPFGLLCALVRHPGALLTKHALLDEVWGHRFVSDSVLKGAISDVRTVLDDDPQHPRFIETVPRRGYRFIAVLTALSAEPPASGSAGFIRAETDVAEQASASTRASAVEPPHVSFVGRAKELASLRRAWDRVTSGKRVVFWIAGEPGIGKTTLIDRFVSGLGEIACARGHCVQHYGSGEPYHPVLEALAELCRSDTAVPPLLRAVAPTWLLQLPWLSTAEQREALLRELVGVNLERMLREMGEFLDRYTERRPLLLVTEDLHWGDRATIQLIDYLARRRSRGRLMWLSSFRLAEVIASDHPLNALRHELHLHGLCEEIVLDSFSEAEVAAYVAERSPSMASDESFVRALHERTEGVPLFVASVTSDVAARSAQSGICHAPRSSRTLRFRRTCSRSSITTWPSSGTNGACCSRRLPCAASSFASTRWRACSNATPSGLRTRAISCCASSSGSLLRVRGIKAIRPRSRTPSVTLSSDKSSTIASRRPLAPSFTAR